MMMYRPRRTALPSDALPSVSRTSRRWLSEMRRPTAVRMTRPALMMPSPPENMSTASTPWPNPLQYSALDTTTNPVTQTAEVAVKSAVTKGAPPEPVLANGSINSTAPAPIRTAKPRVSESRADDEAGSVIRRRSLRRCRRTGAVSRCRGLLTTRSPGRI